MLVAAPSAKDRTTPTRSLGCPRREYMSMIVSALRIGVYTSTVPTPGQVLEATATLLPLPYPAVGVA